MKQTHIYREQTSGYQWREERERGNTGLVLHNQHRGRGKV